jgi:nitrogen PTS system EIIA component
VAAEKWPLITDEIFGLDSPANNYYVFRLFQRDLVFAMQLSIEKIAHALALPKGKIERWIRQGRIPLVRQDNACTFDQHALERWASQHNLTFRPDEPQIQKCTPSDENSLTAALENGGIHYDVAGTQAGEVFQSAVDHLDCVPAANAPLLVEKLIEREALASTGIGKGIAIPHPREPESIGIRNPAVAACFLSAPIEFHALDGRPVSILFILLSPSVQAHLQILSKLSFCLRQEDFVAFLKTRPRPEALMSRLGEMEPLCDQRDPRHR